MARNFESSTHHRRPTAGILGPDPLLCRIAQTTDARQRRKLVQQATEHHLALADRLARQYAHRGIDLDDLTQVARVGLMMAVERYRPEAGASFAAFAVPTIRGELRKHFRDHGWVIRPPRRIQELRARARLTRARFEQAHSREPTTKELADLLQVQPVDLGECDTADTSYAPMSLDVTASDQDTPLSERIGLWAREMEVLPDQLTLRKELRRLTSVERSVLTWRYQEELTQDQIGQRLGVSQMQVSRILSRILTTLRSALTIAPAPRFDGAARG